MLVTSKLLISYKKCSKCKQISKIYENINYVQQFVDNVSMQFEAFGGSTYAETPCRLALYERS